MNERLLREHYQERGLLEAETASAVRAIHDYECYLARHGTTYDDSSVDIMKKYLASLVGSRHNAEKRLLALARYSHLTGKSDVYRYFTSILGVRDIVNNLAARVEQIAGSDAKGRVFDNVQIPPVGSPPESMPPMTKQIVTLMERELSDQDMRTALTGNMHGIPESAFEEERKFYEETGSIDAYLVDYHDRMVKTLEKHAAEDTLWFEQRITDAVVEFVRSEPEVLENVLEGSDRCRFAVKIPENHL